MKVQRYIFLFPLLLSLAMMSCDPGRIYDESLSIDGEDWHRDSVCHFEVNINDSLILSDFYISIRNNTNYPYSNLYLFFTTEFPNGHTTTDTIECILADNSGRWLGNGSGAIKDNLIMLQRALRFPITGVYHFRIEQGMRHESLPGIEDIGIRIEESR